MGVHVLKVTKDARKSTPKQGTAPLLNKPAGSLGTILQKRHHVSEEPKIACVAGLVRLLSGSLANLA